MISFHKIVKGGVEYRFDPLTGEESRLNPTRAKRIRSSLEGSSLEEFIRVSRENCPFCPERVEVITPQFPPSFCLEGRMRKGQSLLFPNLYPFAQNHAIAVLSSAHFLDLDQLTPELLIDNLIVVKDYLLFLNRQDKQARYPLFIFNYMPPSAGSIIHPHSQVMVETQPLPKVKEILEKSEAYFKKNKKNYWEEIIEMERELKERFIWENDSLALIASFAPKGFREVQFIFKGKSSFTKLDERDIDNFASSFSAVLRAYKRMGVGSFNLAFFSSAIDDDLPYFWLHAKLISRPFPRCIYTNDSGPMERLYGVWVIDTLPEEVASKIKEIL